MAPTKITRNADGSMVYEKGTESVSVAKKKITKPKRKSSMAENTNDIKNATKDAIQVLDVAATKAVEKIDMATTKAADKIDLSAAKAVDVLGHAADKATSTIASAAKDAGSLLTSTAAEVTKVDSTRANDDHDILTRMDEKLCGIDARLVRIKDDLKSDIKDLKEHSTIKLDDQRKRIEVLEGYKTGQTILMSIGIGLLSLETGLIIYLFTHLPKV